MFEAGFGHRLNFVSLLGNVFSPFAGDVSGVVEDCGGFFVVDLGSPSSVESSFRRFVRGQYLSCPSDCLLDFFV